MKEWHPGSTWGIPSSKVLGWVRQEGHLLSGVLGRVEAASRVSTSEQQPQDHITTRLVAMMTLVESYRRAVLPQQPGVFYTLSSVISTFQPLDSSTAAPTDRMSHLTSLLSLAVIGPAKMAAGVRRESGHPSPVVPQQPPPNSVCHLGGRVAQNELQEPTTSISKQKEGGVMAPAVPAIVVHCCTVLLLMCRSYYCADV